jgi:cobalt transporter subunit CbtA
MDVLRRIVFAAAISGLIAGGLVTVAHHFGTASIIAKAEVYEKAANATGDGAVSGDAMPGMAHDAAVSDWEPKDGAERTVFTALADILTGVGFALLLAAAYALRGREVGWREGLYWGLAGFATFTLAPGLGLPPEVPGTAAAPLLDRQIWWLATVAITGGGLAFLFLVRRPIWVVTGGLLLVLPHLYGAPQPAAYKSATPEALAHQFVVAAVLTSLVFWLALGSLTGFFYRRLGRTTQVERN